MKAAIFALPLLSCLLTTPAWAQQPIGDAEPADQDSASNPPTAPEAELPASADPAVDAANGNARIFEPPFFAQFAPRNALDMVRRIPGFQIEGSSDARGLGQASGNVLLNGARFSGKSNDVIATLGRISAANVVRIELVDGASLDIPGLQGQIVNVISEASGLTGQYRWSPRWAVNTSVVRALEGEVSLSGRLRGVDFTLSLENSSFRNVDWGPEQVISGTGALLDIREETRREFGDLPSLSGTFQRIASNGNTANLNLALQFFSYRSRELSEQFNGLRTLRDTEDEHSYEIGGDYELGVFGGRLKLIGLHRLEHSPELSLADFDFIDPNLLDTGLRQRTVSDELEYIARSEFSWSRGGNDWQVAAEGALNILDNDFSLAQRTANGDFVVIPLPGANSRVEEQRAEISLTYGRPLAANLSLQASLGGEYSQLSQSGPLGQTRQFVRPKGFVSLAWSPAAIVDLRARVERSVGQLEFFDFVATADIEDDNQNAANPDLVPEQRWEFELGATGNFGAYGQLTATAIYRSIEDIVDQIPIGLTGEAPGNIASAKVLGLDIDGTLTTDPLGLAGGRIDTRVRLRRGTLNDPLTGENRRISNSLIYQVEVDYRHDLPRTDWAYGGGYRRSLRADGFRLDQISDFRETPGNLFLFIEHKNIVGLTVRGLVGNVLGNNNDFRRTVFAGRRTDPIAFIEDRRRQSGPVVRLDITGNF